MVPLEGRTGSHDPGLVFPARLSILPGRRNIEKRRETREKTGERKARHETHTHLQRHATKPPIAWGSVATERCNYGFLQC